MNFIDSLDSLRALLRSGISSKDLKENHGINSKIIDGLMILDYDQLRVKWTEPYGFICRGIILNAASLDVVAFGLDKFFNFGEHYAAKVDFRNCKLFEKLDGTMLQRWYNPIKECFQFSTRFQLPQNMEENTLPDSLLTWHELVGQATKGLEDKLSLQPKDETWVFELCSPYNVVVVHYDKPTIRLISARNISTFEERNIEEIDFPKPQIFSACSGEEVEALVNSFSGQTFEGVVAQSAGPNGQIYRVKFKNIDYVRLHRLADKYVNAGDILNLARSNDFEEIIIQLPKLKDSILLAVDLIKDEISKHEESFARLSILPNKKEFAIALNKEDLLFKAALFSVYNKKAHDVRSVFLDMDDNAFAKLFKPKFMQVAKQKMLQIDFVV